MAAESAFLGISHTPLWGLNPVADEVEAGLREAMAQARQCIAQFRPERVLLIAPDHYNGFFNQLMPTFCIGTEASAVGDFGTPEGPLRVDGDYALSLAATLMDDGFDMAVSRRMRVDHGFAQPLQLLWGGLDTPPIVPLFVNAAAPPTIVRLPRARQLGQSLRRHLDASDARTLVLASGGLSHEPPVPQFASASGVVRERITAPWTMTEEDRQAKLTRVCAAGRALAAGAPDMKPLNPDWDARWMDAIEAGNSDGAIDRLVTLGEDDISRQAGLSAHESKNWLIGRCAVGEERAIRCALRYYRAIPDFIAGFGVLFLH